MLQRSWCSSQLLLLFFPLFFFIPTSCWTSGRAKACPVATSSYWIQGQLSDLLWDGLHQKRVSSFCSGNRFLRKMLSATYIIHQPLPQDQVSISQRSTKVNWWWVFARNCDVAAAAKQSNPFTGILRRNAGSNPATLFLFHSSGRPCEVLTEQDCS